MKVLFYPFSSTKATKSKRAETYLACDQVSGATERCFKSRGSICSGRIPVEICCAKTQSMISFAFETLPRANFADSANFRYRIFENARKNQIG